MIGGAVEQRELLYRLEIQAPATNSRQRPFGRAGGSTSSAKVLGVSHAITVSSLGLVRLGPGSVGRLRLKSRGSGRIQDRSCPAERRLSGAVLQEALPVPVLQRRPAGLDRIPIQQRSSGKKLLCYAEKRTRHSPAAQSFQFLALFRRSWRDSKSESSAFARLRLSRALRKTWMAGTSARSKASSPRPAMTKRVALSPHSDLSMFQKIGVDGPSSTPLSDFRQALGARYWPSGI
jgi:hypothetical protein